MGQCRFLCLIGLVYLTSAGCVRLGFSVGDDGKERRDSTPFPAKDVPSGVSDGGSDLSPIPQDFLLPVEPCPPETRSCASGCCAVCITFADCGATCDEDPQSGFACLQGICVRDCSCFTSCQESQSECGVIEDGCGGILDCGPCKLPKTCGGGGTPNLCGEGPCDPATCGSLGHTCGDHPDGCESTINCGPCVAPEVCTEDNVGVFACECIPDCSPYNECGSDGCGGTCGDCSLGDTCFKDVCYPDVSGTWDCDDDMAYTTCPYVNATSCYPQGYTEFCVYSGPPPGSPWHPPRCICSSLI